MGRKTWLASVFFALASLGVAFDAEAIELRSLCHQHNLLHRSSLKTSKIAGFPEIKLIEDESVPAKFVGEMDLNLNSLADSRARRSPVRCVATHSVEGSGGYVVTSSISGYGTGGDDVYRKVLQYVDQTHGGGVNYEIALTKDERVIGGFSTSDGKQIVITLNTKADTSTDIPGFINKFEFYVMDVEKFEHYSASLAKTSGTPEVKMGHDGKSIYAAAFPGKYSYGPTTYIKLEPR